MGVLRLGMGGVELGGPASACDKTEAGLTQARVGSLWRWTFRALRSAALGMLAASGGLTPVVGQQEFAVMKVADVDLVDLRDLLSFTDSSWVDGGLFLSDGRLAFIDADMTFGSVRIDESMRQKFIKKVCLTKCPAFRANWAFHEGANLDPKVACDTDIADLWHLTGIAYCDVAFADKKTVEALKKGKYDELPKRNSEFSEWIRSLA